MVEVIIVAAIVLTVFAIVMVIARSKGAQSRANRNQKKGQRTFVKVRPASSGSKNKVAVDNTPLHVRRGWITRGGKHYGYYRTPYGAWKGEIERRGDKFEVHIFAPPTGELRRHKRWPCFHNENGNKWRIDLALNPSDRDVGAIVHYVEGVIIESFKNA